MNPTILVVDDEQDIRELVQYNLEKAGYRVITCRDGAEALKRALASPPDAVVLDLLMPVMDGLTVLRSLREEPATADLPVLLLTARSSEMDKLLGFEYGADDYLTKPFGPRELAARVGALLRRRRATGEDEPIESAGLRVDPVRHEVSYRGKALELTRREFGLLYYLARNAGRLCKREELLDKVWGYDYLGETRTVDVHVRRLRAKLGKGSDLIQTVIGSGYRFQQSTGD
ncbi:MAG: response regulator transcription factor [Candidatus Eisenbacteria bacterium]|nr:response regulator transcription factor [Candidatus Eisenbacteria bacterium]